MKLDELTPMHIDQKYDFGETIGKGGQATVMHGTRKEDGKAIVIKSMNGRDEENLPMEEPLGFRREVNILQIANEANAPGFQKLVDFGITPGERRGWIITEPVEGRKLSEIVEGETYIPTKELLKQVVTTLDQTLTFAHTQHLQPITNRDLKPDHIFVDAKVITDWGTAKVITGKTFLPTQFWTEYYTAPEVANPETEYGRPDHRADIYSMGRILQYTILGKELFEAAEGIPTREDFRRTNLPAQAISILEKATKENPKQRHDSVAELSKEFLQAIGEWEYTTNGNEETAVITTNNTSFELTLPADNVPVLHEKFRGKTLIGAIKSMDGAESIDFADWGVPDVNNLAYKRAVAIVSHFNHLKESNSIVERLMDPDESIESLILDMTYFSAFKKKRRKEGISDKVIGKIYEQKVDELEKIYSGAKLALSRKHRWIPGAHLVKTAFYTPDKTAYTMLPTGAAMIGTGLIVKHLLAGATTTSQVPFFLAGTILGSLVAGEAVSRFINQTGMEKALTKLKNDYHRAVQTVNLGYPPVPLKDIRIVYTMDQGRVSYEVGSREWDQKSMGPLEYDKTTLFLRRLKEIGLKGEPVEAMMLTEPKNTWLRYESDVEDFERIKYAVEAHGVPFINAPGNVSIYGPPGIAIVNQRKR